MLSQQQELIREGDAAAFSALCARYSRSVCAAAVRAGLGEAGARAVSRQVFLLLRGEIMLSDRPIDIPRRVQALSADEIRIALLAKGSRAGALWDEPAACPESGAAASGRSVKARARQRLNRTSAQTSASEGEGRSAHARRPVSLLLTLPFFLLLVWLIAGVLMDLSALPVFDLGYSWFNRSIFPLFGAF